MPYVKLEVCGSLSLDQRGRIAAAISEVLQDVAGKPPGVTYVRFVESTSTQWARGDDPTAFEPVCFPVVELKAAGSLSFDQRARIATGFQEVLAAHSKPGNPPGYVVIEEVSRQSWARGGTMLESP